MTSTLAPPPLRWDGSRLHVLDQTRLPAHEEVLVLEGAEDTARAIERLAVRGAPLIGVAAAYGLAMEVAREPSPARWSAAPSGSRHAGRRRATSPGRWSACAPPRWRPARSAWPAPRARPPRRSSATTRPPRPRSAEHGAALLDAALARRRSRPVTRPHPLQLGPPRRVRARHRARRDRRARGPPPGSRVDVRGAAAAAGRAADGVGARAARYRARARRRRRAPRA